MLPSYEEANNPSMQAEEGYCPQYPTTTPYPQNQPQYLPANAGYPTAQPQYLTQAPAHLPASNVPPPAIVNPVTISTVNVVVNQPLPPPQTTVIVAHQLYRPYVFREVPVQMNCPYCHEDMTTHVSYLVGCLAWVICGVTALFGGFCGCCLIPFCIDGCKDIQHNCTKCGRRVGTYNRM